jgi:single-strand DNA-binding protein
MGINKAILVGHVGKDPVIQYVKEDLPVARFTLATSETFKGKSGEKQTTTEWHNIVAWRQTAKVVEQYVKKGAQLYIEGKITNRSYEKDGVTKYFTEIVVDTLQMLGRPDGTSQTAATGIQKEEPAVTDNINEIIDGGGTFEETDDLPF